MKKLIIIICLLLCTGCSDYVEINDLVILSGMVIDYKDNMYEVTSQLIINEDKSTVKVFTTKANTIEEALAEISKLSNKEVFLSHLKILIITKDVIINKKDYYDFFLRDAKSKMNFFVYVVDDSVAKEILNVYKNSDGSSLYIEKMMTFNNKAFSTSTPITFIDLMYRKLEPGYDAIYPSLTIKENNNIKTLYLENLVFFTKDDKKVSLNDNEAIHYNILANNVIKTNVDVSCGNELFSLTLNSAKSKYKWENNKFIISTKINSQINTYECKYDLNKQENIDKLKKLAKNQIKKELEKVIKISKDSRTDILGLSNYIYKHDKKYYENNVDLLTKLNVEVNLDISIISTGEIRR